MLFQVEMTVCLPPDMDAGRAADLKRRECDLAQQLQRLGKWRHLWRVAGKYKNLSVFDVESPAELHQLLSSLPLYPYMKMRVAALCHHPSSIHDDDR